MNEIATILNSNLSVKEKEVQLSKHNEESRQDSYEKGIDYQINNSLYTARELFEMVTGHLPEKDNGFKSTTEIESKSGIQSVEVKLGYMNMKTVIFELTKKAIDEGVSYSPKRSQTEPAKFPKKWALNVIRKLQIDIIQKGILIPDS